MNTIKPGDLVVLSRDVISVRDGGRPIRMGTIGICIKETCNDAMSVFDYAILFAGRKSLTGIYIGEIKKKETWEVDKS